MVLFPTEQWLEQYGRRLDESDALGDVAPGWGVGFDGDIRLVIEEIPLSETTLEELPDEVLADLPEHIRAGVADVTLDEAPSQFDETIRPSLPERVRDLLRQIEENVVDGAIHAHIGLHEGSVTDVEVLGDPDERTAGVVLRGPLGTWQQILGGRPALSALLTRDLQVVGDRPRLLRYSAMFQLLGGIAAEVETTHLFETPRQPLTNTVVDVAAGPPAAIQQLAERRAVRTLQDLLLL